MAIDAVWGQTFFFLLSHFVLLKIMHLLGDGQTDGHRQTHMDTDIHRYRHRYRHTQT